MNLKYVGDALDHWKGSLFDHLQKQGLLLDFAVDPMATDLDQWIDGDFVLFARLLRINRQQIIDHQASLISRSEYFAEITHRGDLFLDPDTGIRTSGSPNPNKYVTPKELAVLLRTTPGRVVVVYQHVRARKTAVRVDGCLCAIAKEIDAVGWCSYESSTVAMLFLCDEDARTLAIATAFRDFLGRHAEYRVRSGINR
jgi:hypothetical protein